MPSSEFSIIDEFFTLKSSQGVPPELGIGDDCAILDVPNDKQLAVSTDTLIEGVHFLASSAPYLLGRKVLAVNLSDLAAMGATPAWVSMAITLPSIDKAWLGQFSDGFFELAKQYNMHLIGGDTTQGPLSITITIMGLLPKTKRLTRSGANVGDSIYVSGSIGNAGLGLQKAQSDEVSVNDADVSAYLNPQPRVELGQQLLGRATSCIDISDGLSADLHHILNASRVGASVIHDTLPLSDSVREHMTCMGDNLWPYSTGDDYELCFTVPASINDIDTKLLAHGITKIGVIEQQPGLRIQLPNGEKVTLNKGYEHFNE
ncbi:MAG TPA: thiamine-phosphate kinase [Cycloclasticus sp.]|jgi:thiamine-monophosphate kinase|nr:thiamine-phosphate kinase [Cycloclasticus sp.]HIL92637.1 thiamine-phosphate kinase [Cycloclasticus sp.]